MDEGWIEKIIKKNMPTEESLKDISKQMLAHNLGMKEDELKVITCLLYTSPSPRDGLLSRMPSSA